MSVTAGGIIGAVTILWLGHIADRRGDRFIYAFWCTAVISASLLVIALGASGFGIVAFYLAFAVAALSVQMLLSSAWPEVMTKAELAVGAGLIWLLRTQVRRRGALAAVT